jgi:sarcosine oxidase, subunit alpha
MEEKKGRTHDRYGRTHQETGEDGRVERRAGEEIDRSRPVAFDFEGKRFSGYEGDTLASALYASGLRIFTRSSRYHRARGLFCVSGRCANCMVNVNGRPNVRACVEPVREGTVVKHQNAWPSLDHDVYSSIERMGRFMPVGFHYKTFINFPWEWRRVRGSMRKLAGLGSLDDELADWKTMGESGDQSGPRPRTDANAFDQEFMHADVAVVGGGPAGIFAALEAGRLGARVVLVDDQASLGGHLRYDDAEVRLEASTGESRYSGRRASQLAEELSDAVSKREGLTVVSGATVFGLYESNLLGLVRGNRLIKLRAKQVVISTGAHERFSLFQNNDIPGVFPASGLQRLIRLYGVRPGKSVAILTDCDVGLGVARTLIGAGVGVSVYADSRTSVDLDGPQQVLGGSGAVILSGYAIKESLGTKRVEGATLVRIDESGRAVEGSERKFACDTICLANSLEADTSLLYQAGCRTVYDVDIGDFIVSEHAASIHSCGDATGIHDLNTSLLQAKVAGLRAAVNLAEGRTAPEVRAARDDLETYSKDLRESESRYREKVRSWKPKLTAAVSGYGGGRGAIATKSFVCICEDVVEEEVLQAISEGFDDIETLKRYTTLSTGPCQGKICLLPSIGLCARETGKSIPQTGRTTSRPPYLPVTMGALAGPELHPTKLTAMHYKHLELGAAMMDLGEWKRPHAYGPVGEEYAAVRGAVGVIDLGTLGRLDVKGKDTPGLLDFVYTHVFSKVQPGKSRYGVICDDAGIILDDGTVTRLSEDHYFITTSTGNVDFVEQWLEWWIAAQNLDAHVTNLTDGLAAVNVAGPRARDLLKKLTQIDISNEAFPYMNSAEGLVAGVPSILLRIGFVGETGWEIHFPAEYGEYFWDALMEAGKEFGIRPFGVEAQRVLRLDKKHIIVSQDTDALSDPFEADMSWIVRFEKDDFVGKAALAAIKRTGPRRMLVGFVMDAGMAHDGDQVYSPEGEDRLIGAVTSARLSPSIGRCVGLALVSSGSAREDGSLKIMTQGKLSEARVTLRPFYDPDGKRLRS